MNDWELIQNYCSDGSESAFETLVKRHVDYVYCAALRQVRDPSLAEDVSQAVFMLLAQKAKTFRADTILISWLFRTTQNIAAHAVRSESRRQQRELEVAKMNPTTTTPETDHQWERVSPVLDEALAALPGKDRDAVLLRFMGRKPFSQVGAELGTSEDAAKKRVSRALARLREFFVRRGTTLSIAALGVLLGERVVHAAPVGLTTKIAAGVLTGTSAASGPAALLKAAARELFWNKVKWGVAIGAGVLAVLSAGTAAMRHNSNPTLVTATPAPAVQTRTLNDSKLAATIDANAVENAADHILRLSVVQSEDRKPIPRARVLVDRWDKKSQRTLDATTDGNGVLNIPIPTNNFVELEVWVSAEDRVPVIVKWQPHEFNEPVLPYTLLLEAGQKASGMVVDQFGEPVPGATIYFQTWEQGGAQTRREHRAFNQGLPPLYTDANGRWTTTQFPPPAPTLGLNIRVTSPAYTPASVSIRELATNLVTVLSNGVALSGQITAADGKPVQHATVAKENGVYINIQADSDGRFSWPHIEPGQVFVHVEAEGFETIDEPVWATNAANECAFTLQPTSNSPPAYADLNGPKVLLHGTVVDAETGQPIPYFKVLMGLSPNPSDWGPDAMLPEARLFGEGHNGRFAWNILRSGGFQLEVAADGYLDSVCEVRGENEGDPLTFKLRPATFLTGHVLTPDGSSARNADLTLTGPNMGGVMQRPGQLIEPNSGFGDARTRTDDEGNFRLRVKAGARGVAIVHESGTALLTFEAATNAPVVLQPWGIVEGTLYLNGQPAPDQTISISGTGKAEADPRITCFFVYRTNTDAQGKFRFDKALPGTVSVEHWVGSYGGGQAIVSLGQTTNVEVKSGSTTTVELRRDGRLVVGHINFQQSPDNIDWGMSEGSLLGKNKYPFALSRDGSIRADDVPPGTYQLSVELKLVTPSPQLFQTTFGSVQKEVVVPASENESKPVDLGSMTIIPAK